MAYSGHQKVSIEIAIVVSLYFYKKVIKIVVWLLSDMGLASIYLIVNHRHFWHKTLTINTKKSNNRQNLEEILIIL